MKTILITLGATLADLLRSRASLQLEILALRQQLAMLPIAIGNDSAFIRANAFFGFGSIVCGPRPYRY